MRPQQRIVTLLLCSVIILSIVSIGLSTNTAAQTAATYTTYQTYTYTYTQQTAQTYSAQFHTDSFTLQGSGGGETCYYYPIALPNNSAGQRITGTISDKGGNIGFYIVNQQYWWFLSGGPARSCGAFMPNPTEYLVKANILSGTTYSVDWKVPDNSGYWIVLWDSSADSQVDVDLYTISVTTESYGLLSFSTNQLLFTSTIPAGPFTFQSIAWTPTVMGYVDIALIILAIVLLAVLAKEIQAWRSVDKRRESKKGLMRRAETKTMPTEQEQLSPKQEAPTESVVPEQKAPTVPTEQFCINCGNKLPLDSKFCNKCGTQQP